MTAIPLDETHDARRRSWVPAANAHPEFPIQNLPLGVFSAAGGAPRGGIAIGDSILDLKAALDAGLFAGEAEKAAAAAAGATLNPWMALDARLRTALRKRVSALLDADGPERVKVEKLATKILHRAAECTLHVPAAIGDFTDFFAGIHHAYNGGVRSGRQPPLLPNYKHVPVAYHSRASSVVASGTALRRPGRPARGAGKGNAGVRARRSGSISSWNWASGSDPGTRSASRSRSRARASTSSGSAC